MFNSNIWPNYGPLEEIKLWNLSAIDLKSKSSPGPKFSVLPRCIPHRPIHSNDSSSLQDIKKTTLCNIWPQSGTQRWHVLMERNKLASATFNLRAPLFMKTMASQTRYLPGIQLTFTTLLYDRDIRLRNLRPWVWPFKPLKVNVTVPLASTYIVSY